MPWPWLMLMLGVCTATQADGVVAVPRYMDSGLQADQPEKSFGAPGYVFDITVQNEKQLDVILDRAEYLKGRFSPNDHGRITLVLHGEELRLFQKSNYNRFTRIVDKARSLDRQKLIDIKACQTAMDQFNIDRTELPDFIEQVPFAPVEIERLQREQGYTRL